MKKGSLTVRGTEDCGGRGSLSPSPTQLSLCLVPVDGAVAPSNMASSAATAVVNDYCASLARLTELKSSEHGWWHTPVTWGLQTEGPGVQGQPGPVSNKQASK